MIKSFERGIFWDNYLFFYYNNGINSFEYHTRNKNNQVSDLKVHIKELIY